MAREELLAAARLARLAFTDEELDRIGRELDGILAHAAQLRRVGTVEGAAGRAPLYADAAGSTSPYAPQLRDDHPGADALLLPPSHLAPEWRAGFFTVPRLRTHDHET